MAVLDRLTVVVEGLACRVRLKPLSEYFKDPGGYTYSLQWSPSQEDDVLSPQYPYRILLHSWIDNEILRNKSTIRDELFVSD